MMYLEKTQHLQNMLDQGQDWKPDEFFHPDLVATEKPGGEQRHGLEEQRKAVREWMAMLKPTTGRVPFSITADEDTATTMAETWVEATFKGAPGPNKMGGGDCVSVGRDKVKEMDFYYHNPMEQGDTA